LTIDHRVQVTQSGRQFDFGDGALKCYISHGYRELLRAVGPRLRGLPCERGVTKMYPDRRDFFSGLPLARLER
jgi:hypothetical protein